MTDEIFDRTYQPGRASLNAAIHRGLGRFVRSLDCAFSAFHRIQFAAPWRKRTRDAGCA